MEQDFELLAQSRANYYTQGSPIQFVRVELLRGTETGEIAVCLTFKNVAEAPITGLVVRFKCKDQNGEVLCEDQFYYEGLTAAKGELFGEDDAVFVSNSSIGSVEVELEQAFLTDGSAVPLGQYKRVRLPAPKALPAQMAEQLQQRTGKKNLTVVPQVLEEGWYCACGAFHPKGEDDAYCSECGSDRILLQNSLSSLLQQTHELETPSSDEATRVVTTLKEEEPTRMMPTMTAQEQFAQSYHSRSSAAQPLPEEENDSDMRLAPDRGDPYSSDPYSSDAYSRESYSGSSYGGQKSYAGEEERVLAPGDPDYMAERIIRWAPPITAGLCALIVAIGFIWYQFL